MRHYTLAFVNGFYGKGNELADALEKNLPVRGRHDIAGAQSPFEKPFDGAARITETLQTLQQEDAQELIVAAYSYGALPALIAALRLRMRRMAGLFLVDGPLLGRADVSPVLRTMSYAHYYEERPRLVRDYEQNLQYVDRSRIVTFGNTEDKVVPPAAKMLPESRVVSLGASAEETAAKIVRVRLCDHEKGTHVVLPFVGHGLREKIPSIVAVIRAALDRPPWLAQV